MKRLMICMLMGCGASQDGPPDTPAPVEEKTPGPSDETVSPEEATLATATERRLYPKKFSASSHLENDWNKFQENYLATYLGDDNPSTAWTEGKPDVGLGETVTVEHTRLEDASASRLEIRNGYQKSPSLFTRNARAKDVTLKLIPSGLLSKHTLSDAEGWQSLSATQPLGPLHGYEIRFDSVYKGTHYEDLVVSDIQTFVTATTPDNPSFELTMQKRLQDWARGRKQAAATFKKAAKGSLPVAPIYKQSSIDDTADPGEQAEDFDGSYPLPFEKAAKHWKLSASAFAGMQKAANGEFQDWKELRISVLDKRKIPQADAFHFPASWTRSEMWVVGDQAAITMPIPSQLAYFSANALKRVFVEGEPVGASSAIRGNAPGCKQKRRDKLYYYSPKSDGPLRQLLIVACGQNETRDGYSQGIYWQLLTYAKDGQLQYIFDFYSAYAFHWKKKDGAPFLQRVSRVSTAGRNNTNYVAK